MIDSSEFRYRITFQNPPTGKDTFGQLSGSWTDVKTVWAKIEGNSGEEGQASNRSQNVSTSYTVTIRYATCFNTSQQIVWGDKVLAISGMVEKENRTYWEISAHDNGKKPETKGGVRLSGAAGVT